MRNPWKPGDTCTTELTVQEPDLAAFPEGGLVHPVLSTFSLAREAEWVCRQFVLPMREAGEEGVGGSVSVYHKSPAVLGARVVFTARLVVVEGNRVDCTWQAHVGEQLIAEGEQTQYILDKARFDARLEKLRVDQLR